MEQTEVNSEFPISEVDQSLSVEGIIEVISIFGKQIDHMTFWGLFHL